MRSFDFVYHSYGWLQANWTPLSPITIINRGPLFFWSKILFYPAHFLNSLFLQISDVLGHGYGKTGKKSGLVAFTSGFLLPLWTGNFCPLADILLASQICNGGWNRGWYMQSNCTKSSTSKLNGLINVSTQRFRPIVLGFCHYSLHPQVSV